MLTVLVFVRGGDVSVWMGSFGPAEDGGTEETAAWTVGSGTEWAAA